MGLSPWNTPFDVALVGGGQVTFVDIFHQQRMRIANSHFTSCIIPQSNYECQALAHLTIPLINPFMNHHLIRSGKCF